MQRRNLRGVAARNVGDLIGVVRRGAVARAGIGVLTQEEAADASLPHRAVRQHLRDVSEGHVWNRRVHALGSDEWTRERGRRRIDPSLLVKALHHLQRRREPPIQLSEPLVLLVRARKGRVRAGLAVVVAQVLVRTEEPEPVAFHRSSHARGEVPVSDSLVPARGRRASSDRKHDRLRRQAGWLTIVRSLAGKAGAALLRDDVEHAPLHVAEFDRRPHRLHVQLLDDVDDRFRARDALTRTGEVGAVDEKGVLVHAGSEYGDRVD